MTKTDWDNITRVIAKGAFFAIQGAARQMIEQGSGRIIHMVSIAGKGFHKSPNVMYAGTKGALIAMTRTDAYHLGPHVISVEQFRSNMFSMIANWQANKET